MKVHTLVSAQVELDDRAQREVVNRWLRERFRFSQGYGATTFIRDGSLIKSEERSAGSHSYDDETILRKATAEDEVILRLIDETSR